MSFSSILFTDKGRALQSKALAGANLNFTKIVMGSGNLGGQSQITLTAVIDPKVNLSITSLQHKSNYATVKGVFSNSDISEGFYWRELGVYAQDPDLGEILYCYGNAGALAEYIPSQSSGIIEKVVSVSLIVGNVALVSATIDESLVYASKEDLIALESDLRAKVAGGTGTAITVNMDSTTAYIPGMVVRIIATADNNSEATTLKINDLLEKPVYKINAQTAPKIVAGKPYTLILSADQSRFFLDASASGSARAEHVLAPYTVSTDEDTDIVGTMANNGPEVAGTLTLTTEGQEFVIAKGFHSGLRKIKIAITGLIASVIKAGTTVGGILGTFTSDANATADKILVGSSGYVNGVKVNGNVPIVGSDKAATNITAQSGRLYMQPPPGAFFPSTGYFVYADDPDFAPANFLANKNMFGLQGGIPLRGDEEYLHWRRAIADEANNTDASGAGRVHLRVPAGAYLSVLSNGEVGIFCDDPDYNSTNILNTANIFGKPGSIPVLYPNNGSDRRLAEQVYSEPTVIFYKITADAYYAGVNWILAIDPDFIPANILNTANVFGIQGTAVAGKRFASGTIASNMSSESFYGPANTYGLFRVVVSGLSFKPSIIAISHSDVYAGKTRERLTLYRATGAIISNQVTVMFMSSDDYNPVLYTINGATAPAYVVNGGFCLPTMVQGQTVSWSAWE